MVFQNYCLFKNKTVLENIMMPLVLVQKKKRETALEIALQLLEQVGLKDKQHCYPSRLSGGQQQRVGIARALAVNLAVGLRYCNGVNVVNWPLGRVLMSYYASTYVRIVTGMKVRDTTAGFKCYRREVLETIELDKIRFKGYAF